MNGGLYKKMGKNDRPRRYIGVTNMDESLKTMTAGVGKVVQAKMPIPGIGYFALVTDPEGNPVALF